MESQTKEERFKISLTDSKTNLSMNYEASNSRKLTKFFKTFLKDAKKLSS